MSKHILTRSSEDKEYSMDKHKASHDFSDPHTFPLVDHVKYTEQGQLLVETVSGGVKFDQGKPRMELLPAVALEEIAKVLTFGASKYQPHNWTKGISYSRLLGAALRHLTAFMKGEDNDPESGLSHLSHLGCCIIFLIWMSKHRSDLDDRFKDPV